MSTLWGVGRKDTGARGRQRICYRVSASTLELAEAAAARAGLTLNVLARRALEAALRAQPGAGAGAAVALGASAPPAPSAAEPGPGRQSPRSKVSTPSPEQPEKVSTQTGQRELELVYDDE